MPAGGVVVFAGSFFAAGIDQVQITRAMIVSMLGDCCSGVLNGMQIAELGHDRFNDQPKQQHRHETGAQQSGQPGQMGMHLN